MTNIYKLALQVQDASNMNGVVNSLYNEVLPAIRQEPGYREQGTAYLNSHPVVLMFLDKLVSLTGHGWIRDHDGAIARAYDMAHDFSEGIMGALMDGETVHIQANAETADLLLPYEGKADACYGCGMVEPMGRHYADCTLLEDGDEVVVR